MRPNPTSGRVELVFSAEKATEVGIGLIDLNGRVHIQRQVFKCSAGRNVIALDLADKGLAPGTYIITARGGNQVIWKKVIYHPH